MNLAQRLTSSVNLTANGSVTTDYSIDAFCIVRIQIFIQGVSYVSILIHGWDSGSVSSVVGGNWSNPEIELFRISNGGRIRITNTSSEALTVYLGFIEL